MANVYMRTDYGESGNPQKAAIQTEPYVLYFCWPERLPDTSVFTASDISVTNGTLSDFRFTFGNNEITTYQATITPPTTGTGNTTITVNANVYDSNPTETATYPYAQSVQNTIKIYTAPSGSQTGPFWTYIVIYTTPEITRGIFEVSNFGISAYLMTFTQEDITITNGEMSNYTGVIVPEGATFGDASVKFLVTPDDSVSNVTITVRANAIGNNAETTLTVPISSEDFNVTTSQANIPTGTTFGFIVRPAGNRQVRGSTVVGNFYYYMTGGSPPHFLYRIDLTTGVETTFPIDFMTDNQSVVGLANIGTQLYFFRSQSSGRRLSLNRLDFVPVTQRYIRVPVFTYTTSGNDTYVNNGVTYANGAFHVLRSYAVGVSYRTQSLQFSTTAFQSVVTFDDNLYVPQGIDYYNGNFYFITSNTPVASQTKVNNALYRVPSTTNPTAGTAVRVGMADRFGISESGGALAISSTGTAYMQAADRNIYTLDLTTGSATVYEIIETLGTSDIVSSTAFSNTKRYFAINKSVRGNVSTKLIRFSAALIHQDTKELDFTEILDMCELGDSVYLIYEQSNSIILGIWLDDESSPRTLSTLTSSDRFIICYNNQIFTTDISSTTFKCYSLTGERLAQNDFSLIHTQPRGIIKSLSSSDRGVNLTHRLGNSTFIYRYNTRGIFVDSVSIFTRPSNLLLKATDYHAGLFYVVNENLLIEGGITKISIHRVAISGPFGIQYIGPSKISANNFVAIDLKELFEGEVEIHEGIGILLEVDFTLVDGVLTLEFIRGGDWIFGTDEIFFPFVALNNATFLEQEIYFTFKERLDLPIPNDSNTIIAEQPDRIDLHEFAKNAINIKFKTGTTIPPGTTIVNETLIIAENTVTEDSEFPIELTYDNAIGEVDKKYRLIILNTHSNLKAASYWQTDIIERVYINDIEVTEYVQSINELDLSLDSRFLNIQKVSDATVTLNDPDGFFSSPTYDNFFSQNGLNRFGFNVEIKIEYGYQTNQGTSTRILFFGHILRISQNTDRGTATVVAIDYSEQVLSSQLHDFGIAKKIIYTGTGLIGKYHGEYNLSDIFLPLSDQSLVGRARNFAFLNSQNQNSLATEGIANWANIKIAGDHIESEGGLIPYSPIFTFKSPYRYNTIEEILRALLINQRIFNFRFDIISPTEGVPHHFQNLGSAVYQHEENQKFSLRDWFGFGGDSYYLLGSLDRSENDKFIKKQENKVIADLYIADPNISLWKVAIEPTRNILWIWSSQKYIGDNIPLGTYDSSESNNKTRLIRYNMNTDDLTVSIPSNHTNAIQLAHRYLLGERNNILNLRQFSLPNNRVNAVNWYDMSIGDWLYYKFANTTHFGISRFDLVNETITQTISQINDNYGNASCFDLALQGDAVFFAYTVGETSRSTLYIKQFNPRTSTTTTFYQATTDYTSTDFFGEIPNRTGAIYNGVLEIFATANHVYANVQLQKEDPTIDNARSYERNGGAILYKIPRTGTVNPTANNGEQYKIKLYEFVQLSPHSFVVYNDNVHFFEGCPHLYKFKPILADGVEADWRDKSGFVRYEENGEIKNLGLAWRQITDQGDSRYDNIYGAIDSPMRRVGNDLHLFLGKDDVSLPDENDTIGDYEEIIYRDSIEPVVPILESNGKTVYDLLNIINQITYTFSRFENNKLVLQSKLTKTADFAGITGTTLTFSNLNGEIPIVGFVKIGQEFIAYSGTTSNTLLNIRRNQLGTVSRFYPDGENMLFFDHIIDATAVDNPILSINFQNDYNFLVNAVAVQYGQQRTSYLEDQRSIELNDRKEAIVETVLDDHQRIWAEKITELYLSELKDLKQRIHLSLKPSFFLRLGQVVILRYPDRAQIDSPCRITRLQFGKDRTNVTLKTLTEEIVTKLATTRVFRPQNGIAFDTLENILYYHTRYQNRFGYFDTNPNGEIVGTDTTYTFSDSNGNNIRLDWPANESISGRNHYIKDLMVRTSTTNASILIRNLDTDISELQYFNRTNRENPNYSMVVDNEQNIYVGELLAGENILRRVVPVSNPSTTNLMTIAPDYIELRQRGFSRSRGHLINVLGLQSLTWYNGSIYGVDMNNNLLIELAVEDIPGSINKRAVITENIISIPSEIVGLGDLARGDGCWYLIGSDSTPQPGRRSQDSILWIYTILD